MLRGLESGNQLHWSALQYEWDPFNNLKTLQGQGNHRTYLYTVDDERIWTSNYTGPEAPDTWSFTLRGLDNKVLTVYEAEGNGPGSWRWIKDYIYRDGLQLAAEYADGRQRHFTLDHLGTPRMLSDKAGFYKADYHYFGFGEQINPKPPGEPSEALKFTGHERDFNSNSGAGDDLDYMHARYCNTNTGRFLSVDPVGGSPRSSISWNRYSYARNNPTRFVDTDGLQIKIANGQGATQLRTLLIETLTRPRGRAKLRRLARNKNETFTFKAKQFQVNVASRRTLSRNPSASVAINFGQTARRLTQSKEGSSTTGADITLDLSAIRDFHADSTGLRTVNHEIYHAADIESGLPDSEVQKGDQPSSATGPANDYGLNVFDQPPTISVYEAGAIFNEEYLCAPDCESSNQEGGN